jgi:hypothetical protein
MEEKFLHWLIKYVKKKIHLEKVYNVGGIQTELSSFYD